MYVQISVWKLKSTSLAVKNIVNVTVELSSFGRPNKEKLEPHLRPLREATTTTWSKYFLGHSKKKHPSRTLSLMHTGKDGIHFLVNTVLAGTAPSLPPADRLR
ncbi:hypothetical protein Taro_011103 [Colocasia esculenta]|uniref:Uncharacterized protein n=1 Tax=Colocasia esculenta TaxID=4460 RepID=A0A843U9P4_COLES|nr:hypothetical protein [Colocasia esculenta]